MISFCFRRGLEILRQQVFESLLASKRRLIQQQGSLFRVLSDLVKIDLNEVILMSELLRVDNLRFFARSSRASPSLVIADFRMRWYLIDWHFS